MWKSNDRHAAIDAYFTATMANNTKRAAMILLLLFTCAFLRAQKGVITITNKSAHAREEVVAFPWRTALQHYPNLDSAFFKVVNAGTKKEYPVQLASNGTDSVQQLLVYVAVPAKGAINLQLVKGKRAPFASKTYCRFVPERKDDFAWENDRIAFRVYGKALEQTPNEMAYGIDVWVKRTDSLVINKRYRRGNYHEDAGDGLDYYHVGLTLGAGGIAPFTADTIRYPGSFSSWKILDNGPLRSTFQLVYDEWNAGNKKLRMTKTVSIDAGSQFTRTEVQFATNDNEPLPVVTGIIKRREAGAMLLNEQEDLLAYWEPQHGKDGTTGVACIMEAPVIKMGVDATHLLAHSVAAPQQPFVYYHGAAWDKGGSIASAKDWFAHVQTFRAKLQQPLVVSIQ